MKFNFLNYMGLTILFAVFMTKYNIDLSLAEHILIFIGLWSISFEYHKEENK